MAEIVALALVAMFDLKRCERFGCFYALCNDGYLQIFSHGNHGTNDGGMVRAACHLMHERLVNLQGIDRKLIQIT